MGRGEACTLVPDLKHSRYGSPHVEPQIVSFTVALLLSSALPINRSIVWLENGRLLVLWAVCSADLSLYPPEHPLVAYEDRGFRAK